ncbi:hypothetical protein O3M35_006589 [Rhynocoris fuscipes]|uniref:Suppressor of fused homolog n=1 Tax=Rhynocoris fuscipes TaxID=488301 RepID=A0AAW1DEA6_9HEMI
MMVDSDSSSPPLLPGLEALLFACSRIYPDQPNPLQVTALIKYWLGGPDPLDYISMYSNPGNPQLGIPPHWHYISFGLSDLHGDGRVHESRSVDERSGYGFELTFRLKREIGETAPPTWPANLLQSLAKYVFSSGNIFCAGDHISWNAALDGSESLIQHMLIDNDPQLGTVNTACGTVDFIQIVGATYEEMKAAQKWNGKGVLELLKNVPNSGCGGLWLVTDMRRGETLFQLDPNAIQLVETGIETDGSNLSGVTASCSWTENCEIKAYGGFDGSKEYEDTVQCGSGKENLTCDGQSFDGGLESKELMPNKVLESLHLTFNLESGSLLPLALRGRLKHGRHFTIKSATNATAITFVAESVSGTFVDTDKPYVSRGSWVQILVNEELANQLLEKLQPLANNPEQIALPITYTWEDRKLSITIVSDDKYPDFNNIDS